MITDKLDECISDFGARTEINPHFIVLGKMEYKAFKDAIQEQVLYADGNINVGTEYKGVRIVRSHENSFLACGINYR